VKKVLSRAFACNADEVKETAEICMMKTMGIGSLKARLTFYKTTPYQILSRRSNQGGCDGWDVEYSKER
jgi:hypothetical protein